MAKSKALAALNKTFSPYSGFRTKMAIGVIEAPIGKWIGPPRPENTTYYAKKCSIKNCTGKPLYRWWKKAFCKAHKQDAIEWVEKTRPYNKKWQENNIIKEANDKSVTEAKNVSY